MVTCKMTITIKNYTIIITNSNEIETYPHPLAKYGWFYLVLIGAALSFDVCANLFKLDENQVYVSSSSLSSGGGVADGSGGDMNMYSAYIFRLLSEFTINKPLMFISLIGGWISLLFMDKYGMEYQQQCLKLIINHVNQANKMYGSCKDKNGNYIYKNIVFKLVNTECCCNCHSDKDTTIPTLDNGRMRNVMDKDGNIAGKKFAVVIFKKQEKLDNQIKIMQEKMSKMEKMIENLQKQLDNVQNVQ